MEQRRGWPRGPSGSWTLIVLLLMMAIAVAHNEARAENDILGDNVFLRLKQEGQGLNTDGGQCDDQDGQCTDQFCFRPHCTDRYCLRQNGRGSCDGACMAKFQFCSDSNCCQPFTCTQFCQSGRTYAKRGGLKGRKMKAWIRKWRQKCKCAAASESMAAPTPAPSPALSTDSGQFCRNSCDYFCETATDRCKNRSCARKRKRCSKGCNCSPLSCRQLCNSEKGAESQCAIKGWNAEKCEVETSRCRNSKRSCALTKTGTPGPTLLPTGKSPTSSPATSHPSPAPSSVPSQQPSSPRGASSSRGPTGSPSFPPSPGLSLAPTKSSGSVPSKRPSRRPSPVPSRRPSPVASPGPSNTSGTSSSPSESPSLKPSSGSWLKLGNDMVGELGGDRSAVCVSISGNGLRVAIGADQANAANGSSDTGHVRVYEYSGGAWGQIGGDIDGEAQGDRSGNAVSMNADGSRVAIGARFNGTNRGHVRVYQSTGGAWAQIGVDINGETDGDGFGSSVSMSADGNRLAVGAQYNYGASGSSVGVGHVRVFEYISNKGGSFSQIGADIDGEEAGDESGFAVSLSADGTRVAIGAKSNDGNGPSSGHVRVYAYSGGSWAQIGPDIDGEASGDGSGGSVSLSSDGSRIAVGAPGNASARGHVRVYAYSSGGWQKLGGDIDGEAAGDSFGWSVSLSADGSRVAVGAPYNDGSSGDSGHVRVYDYRGSSWVQAGVDLDGLSARDSFGGSVSMSTDGSRVAIGAPDSDGPSGVNNGRVQVYKY